MHHSIFLSLLVLLIAVNLCEAAIENFVLHKRTTVWGRTVFRIRRPSSLEQCAQTCLNHAKCRAFVYSRMTHYCYGRKQSYPANRNHWRRSARYDYYEQNDNRYPVQERIPARRDFSIVENSKHAASVHRQQTTIVRRPDYPSRQTSYHRERPLPTRTTTTERPVTTTSRPPITRPTTTTRRTTTTTIKTATSAARSRRPQPPRRPEAPRRPTATSKKIIPTRRPQPPRRPVAPRRPTKTSKKIVPTRRPQPPRRRPPVPPRRLDETTKPSTQTMSTLRTTTMTTTKQTRRPVTTTTTTTTRTTTEQTTRGRPPTVVPELSCDQAVGIGDGTILDDQIKASSSYWTFVPANGRLETGSGWMAGTTKDKEYLEIDFGGPKEIVAVATQGGKYFFASEYTQTYKLQFTRNNDDAFETYRERGQERIFVGNTDASGIVKNKLLTPVEVYKIRFLPITFYSNVLLRVEAYEAC